ncbi:hypothetical protein PV797_13980 [Clostridiaceae bacterium M8S5]|nr:hypothetical protein PV797_13980 [Clostridiaceae bacterium M8S5]
MNYLTLLIVGIVFIVILELIKELLIKKDKEIKIIERLKTAIGIPMLAYIIYISTDNWSEFFISLTLFLLISSWVYLYLKNSKKYNDNCFIASILMMIILLSYLVLQRYSLNNILKALYYSFIGSLVLDTWENRDLKDDKIITINIITAIIVCAIIAFGRNYNKPERYAIKELENRGYEIAKEHEIKGYSKTRFEPIVVRIFGEEVDSLRRLLFDVEYYKNKIIKIKKY